MKGTKAHGKQAQGNCNISRQHEEEFHRKSTKLDENSGLERDLRVSEEKERGEGRARGRTGKVGGGFRGGIGAIFLGRRMENIIEVEITRHGRTGGLRVRGRGGGRQVWAKGSVGVLDRLKGQWKGPREDRRGRQGSEDSQRVLQSIERRLSRVTWPRASCHSSEPELSCPGHDRHVRLFCQF